MLSERWVEWMNANLNMSQEKLKFAFGYNSIKESEHGKN
jgi:hypothetical protein